MACSVFFPNRKSRFPLFVSGMMDVFEYRMFLGTANRTPPSLFLKITFNIIFLNDRIKNTTGLPVDECAIPLVSWVSAGLRSAPQKP